MAVRMSEQHENQKGVARVILTFDENELVITDTPFGALVQLSGCSPSGELGGPALPTKVIRVALPPGTEATGIRSRAEERVTVLEGPVLLAPLQPARPARGNVKRDDQPPIRRDDIRYQLPDRELSKIPSLKERLAEEPFFEPLPPPEYVPPVEALYEQELRQRRPRSHLVGTEQIGLNPIAIVEVSPVRFSKEGHLQLATSISLTISYDVKQAPPLEEMVEDEDDILAFKTTRQPIVSRSQAKRVVELGRMAVINPEQIIDIGAILAPLITTADYLIITDNYRWNADTAEKLGSASGNIIAEFQRLADWKSKRGLTAHVVTISQIVGGAYGDFTTGARDLHEVIRNFVKHAVTNWGLTWLLLGGDIDILPARKVVGFADGAIGKTTTNPPEKHRYFWAGNYGRLYSPGHNSGHDLLNAVNGLHIPYDSSGSSGSTQRGWYFTTNNNYTTRSVTATDYIRVNGPASQVNADLQWVTNSNTIPTDLYYASLFGPTYNVSGKHDWDLVDNEFYGTHNETADMDGVRYQADVSVGRAPVASATEAAAFVNKVIAYESYRRPDGTPLSDAWTRKMLFGAANWGGRIGISSTASSPPTDNRYHHASGSDHTLIKLKDAFSDLDWRLLVQVSATDIRLMPYNRNASGASRGWHYVQSATNLAISENTINVLGITFHFPLPSEWVAVYGPAEELTPELFVFDNTNVDGSLRDQEQLRGQIVSELPAVNNIYRLYEDEIDMTPAQQAAAPYAHLTEPRMLDKINEGQHFVSLSGHGWWGGCCGYSLNTAQNSTNGYHSYIAYADSCSTNEFDHDDAVSEKSVLNPNGGAVAYIGNTRFSWIGVGDNFQRAFFHRLTTTRHLGLLNDIRCSMVNESTGFWKRYNKWAIFALNLIGDPEMPVWVGPPKILYVDLPHELDKRDSFRISVSRRGFLGLLFPIPGATVTINQGSIQRQAITDSTGRVSFDISYFELGQVDVTITKLGYRPVFENADIVGPLWVSGLVRVVWHQRVSADHSYVQLNLDQPVENDGIRGWYAMKNLPDYQIILDAVTDAYVSEKRINLLVKSLKEGGQIEKFRLGSTTISAVLPPADSKVLRTDRVPLETIGPGDVTDETASETATTIDDDGPTAGE